MLIRETTNRYNLCRSRLCEIAMPGSTLLYGPPGCGKSLLAKASFGEAHQQFLDDYTAIGAIASAETEQRTETGLRALEYLGKASRWAFDTATKIGETVAAAAIKEALGIK